ncbi:sensor histidine kinase [Allonocardiopsis opalescens]|uniref:histidine kinase n=1 Tax=Allonocardiopsis opalescens TaxID=1144618 RepID=A0A2T0Q9U3_9ACTN|nr:HAMP domain-containing sensor histidine kinase [Allonocardiopsis opalescens]PRY00582.1 two-component system OmpR family sensor kinase [Allonocardiopsis opalescens]
MRERWRRLRRRPRPPGARPRTLRRRLVVTVASVVTLISLVICVGSVLTLRTVLMDQLDQRVRTAIGRTAGPAPALRAPPGQDVSPVEMILAAPGTEAGMVLVISDGRELHAGYLDRDSAVRPLPDEQLERLLAAAEPGPVHGADLGGELGGYRVALATTPGSAFLVGLPTRPADTAVLQLAVTIAAVSAVGVAVLVAFAAGYIRFALRPLESVARTAARVADLPLDRDAALGERVTAGGADPGTETGQVIAAFNRMLGHIERSLTARQASEDKVRRFVADASHELRTPLSAIRGYSELTRRMGEGLPADAVYALDRIEAETVRMTALVEDLLLLARLDEGRELERRTVSLPRLVIDAVNDARVAGGGHRWLLEIDAEPAEATVLGDAHRLQQVVANLLSNARVHTPPGTRVTVGLRGDRAAGTVVLTVSDDGPGIAPEQRDAVFERFTRADGSRARATGSTGLGLAIVRAVVRAHGGEADLAGGPGATVFTVRLPAAPA